MGGATTYKGGGLPGVYGCGCMHLWVRGKHREQKETVTKKKRSQQGQTTDDNVKDGQRKMGGGGGGGKRWESF